MYKSQRQAIFLLCKVRLWKSSRATGWMERNDNLRLIGKKKFSGMCASNKIQANKVEGRGVVGGVTTTTGFCADNMRSGRTPKVGGIIMKL